ncbi:unnamed protein product, partial [Rotaria sp. Silwood2]
MPTELEASLSIVGLQLTSYGYSLWLIFGAPGGLLNIMILSRRQFRQTSCCN